MEEPVSGRRCPGLHCPGCKDKGGAGLIALVVVLVVVGAVLRAIWHTLVTVLEIAAITAASIAGLALVAGGAYAAVRVGRYVLERRARRPIPVRAQVVRLGAELVSAEPERPAIDQPRQQAAGWPLPGWWEEVKPRIGGDG
jgi:hypothetical protein